MGDNLAPYGPPQLPLRMLFRSTRLAAASLWDLDLIEPGNQLHLESVQSLPQRFHPRSLSSRDCIGADFQVHLHERRIVDVVPQQRFHSLRDPFQVSFLELDAGSYGLDEFLIVFRRFFPIRELSFQRSQRARKSSRRYQTRASWVYAFAITSWE